MKKHQKIIDRSLLKDRLKQMIKAAKSNIRVNVRDHDYGEAAYNDGQLAALELVYALVKDEYFES